MMTPSWISAIQGIITLLTSSGQTTQRRGTLKVAGGLSVFDDGTQSVLGGTQEITGAGTWDGKSSQVVVLGSGARSIALPDPATTLQTRGFALQVLDGAGNAGGNTITLDPSGAGVINGAATKTLTANGDTARLYWISAGVWIGTKGTAL